MDRIDVINLIKECVKKCGEELDEYDFSPVDYAKQIILFEAAEKYLLHLVSAEECKKPLNWYFEVWNDDDIEKALKNAHLYVNKENIRMVREKCSMLFNKAEREEKLNSFVKELELIAQEKRIKKDRESLIEINCFDSSFSPDIYAVLCRLPIRVYIDADNPEVYYSSLFEGDEPQEVGDKLKFQCWLESFIEDDEVIPASTYIAMILDDYGVLLSIDQYGNYHVEEVEL